MTSPCRYDRKWERNNNKRKADKLPTRFRKGHKWTYRTGIFMLSVSFPNCKVVLGFYYECAIATHSICMLFLCVKLDLRLNFWNCHLYPVVLDQSFNFYYKMSHITQIPYSMSYAEYVFEKWSSKKNNCVTTSYHRY